jgi:hypothetical protein
MSAIKRCGRRALAAGSVTGSGMVCADKRVP